jgi:hypothetical protein
MWQEAFAAQGPREDGEFVVLHPLGLFFSASQSMAALSYAHLLIRL